MKTSRQIGCCCHNLIPWSIKHLGRQNSPLMTSHRNHHSVQKMLVYYVQTKLLPTMSFEMILTNDSEEIFLYLYTEDSSAVLTSFLCEVFSVFIQRSFFWHLNCKFLLWTHFGFKRLCETQIVLWNTSLIQMHNLHWRIQGMGEPFSFL